MHRRLPWIILAILLTVIVAAFFLRIPATDAPPPSSQPRVTGPFAPPSVQEPTSLPPAP